MLLMKKRREEEFDPIGGGWNGEQRRRDDRSNADRRGEGKIGVLKGSRDWVSIEKVAEDRGNGIRKIEKEDFDLGKQKADSGEDGKVSAPGRSDSGERKGNSGEDMENSGTSPKSSGVGRKALVAGKQRAVENGGVKMATVVSFFFHSLFSVSRITCVAFASCKLLKVDAAHALLVNHHIRVGSCGANLDCLIVGQIYFEWYRVQISIVGAHCGVPLHWLTIYVPQSFKRSKN